MGKWGKYIKKANKTTVNKRTFPEAYVQLLI